MSTLGIIGLCAECFLIGAALVVMLWRRSLEREQRVHAQVGDLWESIGGHPRTRGLCEVIKPNVNTEAGADSWVMRRCEDGKTLYMHHRQRMAGDWILCMRNGRVMRRALDVAATIKANQTENP